MSTDTATSTHVGAPSVMRETMNTQAAELRRLLGDEKGVAEVAERLRDREVLVIGTGTSWHAANQATHLLRLAGVRASAAQSFDVALQGPVPGAGGVLVALSHTGSKRYTLGAVERAKAAGADVVLVSGQGVEGADLVTVAQERSPAYTASHIGALLRIAQVARVLGADLGDLDAVPDAVDAAFVAPLDFGPPPERLMEFVGGGINEWTAAEGALKIREAARVVSEGLAVEQFLHGPALGMSPQDRIVVLDGGGPWSDRLHQVADMMERTGIPVTRIVDKSLSEPLSIFPLMVGVQRASLQTAESLGTSPDSLGLDRPGWDGWFEFFTSSAF